MFETKSFVESTKNDLLDKLCASLDLAFGGTDSIKPSEEWLKCSQDPCYFIRTYCMIQDQATEQAIPFALYPCQTDVLRVLESQDRLIVLKARQLGLTWLSAAYALHLCLFHAQQFVLVISIKQELSTEYADRIKFMFDRLPDELKPAVYKRTESVLWFGQEQRDGIGNIKIVGLNSQIRSVPTSPEAGRAKTVSLLITDEAGFITDIERIWRAAEPTLEISKGKAIVISTANGFGGWFHTLWQRAQRKENDFTPIFLPWSAHPDRDEAWHKEKLRFAVREDDVYQEYPRTPEEAFISSGRPFFPGKVLSAYLEATSKPTARGILSFEGERVVFHEDDRGFLRCWQFPEDRSQYVIGADVAEGLAHGDYSCAHVLNAATLEVVAEFHAHIDPDLFAVELWKLGHFYNSAYLGVERNNHGISTLTVLRQGHPSYPWTTPYLQLYQETTIDQTTNKTTNRPGWLTNLKSRPLMLDDLARVVREMLIGLPSREVIGELMTFVVTDSGKPQAVEGSFDDRVMSLGIALQMQQRRSGLLLADCDLS